MRKHLFATALLLIAMSSCQTKTEVLPLAKVDVKGKASAESLFLEGGTMSLETKDECLISEIDKMTIQDDRIYIKDGEKIFVFDRNGKFLYKIDKRGNGPGEYVDLCDFAVWKSSVYVLSRTKKSIYVYNPQGDYEKTYTLNDWYESLYIQDDACIFLYSAYSNKQEYNIVVYNPQTDSYPKKFAPFGKNQNYVASSWVFHPTEKGLYVTMPFDYTIYRLTKDALTPVLQLTFNTDYNLLKDESVAKVADASKNKNVVRHIDMLDSDGQCYYIGFTLFHEGRGIKKHISKIDKSTLETQTCLLADAENARFPFISNVKDLFQGYLVASCSAGSVLGIEKYYGIDKLTKSGLDREDNPVICTYRIKS